MAKVELHSTKVDTGPIGRSVPETSHLVLTKLCVACSVCFSSTLPKSSALPKQRKTSTSKLDHRLVRVTTTKMIISKQNRRLVSRIRRTTGGNFLATS